MSGGVVAAGGELLAQELLRGEVRSRAKAGVVVGEGFVSVLAWLACHGGLSGG
ncbi:MAG: hypothetical protein R2749_08855 [Acidimicrobiales bacterium]